MVLVVLELGAGASGSGARLGTGFLRVSNRRNYASLLGYLPRKEYSMIFTLRSGEVAVFGSELIGGSQAAKNLGLCLKAVSEYLGRPHKVTSVIFVTDDRLPDRLAACGMDSGAVVVNIMHVFCAAYDITSIKEPEISISSLFWHNVYAAYIHEALHLDNEAATEDEIDATAKALVYDIVRDNGMEPAIHCQFLDAQIGEMTANVDDDYSVTQEKMLENRWWFWRKPAKAVTDYKCHSFREYMHLFSGAHEEDHRWVNQPRLKSIAISDTNTSAPATAASNPVAAACLAMETGNKGNEYSDADIQAFIEEERRQRMEAEWQEAEYERQLPARIIVKIETNKE